MSIVPLHLQRRFEQRWAARFGSPVASNVPKSQERGYEKDIPLGSPRVGETPESGNISCAAHLFPPGRAQSSLPTG